MSRQQATVRAQLPFTVKSRFSFAGFRACSTLRFQLSAFSVSAFPSPPHPSTRGPLPHLPRRNHRARGRLRPSSPPNGDQPITALHPPVSAFSFPPTDHWPLITDHRPLFSCP